jgi:hypothetical protein
MGVKTQAATGSRGAIHVGQEKVYGVIEPPTHLIEFTSESISASEDTLMSEAIRESRGRHHIIRGTLDIQGDINFEQNASGLGILYKNALGDYIRLDNTDGGVHARCERDGVVVIETPASLHSPTQQPLRFVIPFTRDHTGGFKPTGTAPNLPKLNVVTRNNFGQLEELNNSGAGYDYNSYNVSAETYMLGQAVEDDSYVGGSGTNVVALPVAWVKDYTGALVSPDFNPNGGIIKVGHFRKELHYFAYDAGDAVSGGKLFISPASLDVANIAQIELEYDSSYVLGLASVVKLGHRDVSDPQNHVVVDNFQDAALICKLGNWVYQFDSTLSGVYTHHIERGKRLPVGLTIEIDRDAAIFVYTGARVNTLTCNFESRAIATGTVSFVGKAEYAMSTLEMDALPGAKEIVVDKIEAFPASLIESAPQGDYDPAKPVGMLTIREETEIYYQWIVKRPDGRFTLGGIPASGDNSIQLFHPMRSNVDSRSSIKAENVYVGLDTPMTAFEIMCYIDGYFEEVLSASFTVNHNLDTDKFFLGDRFRAFAVEGRTEIEGTLGMEFDDGKHYIKFLNGEYFALEIKCISEDFDAIIPGTEVPSQAYFFMPRCKFSGETPTIDGPDIINHDMPFMATYDDKLKTTDLVAIFVNGNPHDVEAAPPTP